MSFLLVLCSSSFDGHDEEGALEIQDEAATDGYSAVIRANGGDAGLKEVQIISQHIPIWLSYSTPDEFLVWLIIHT